MTRRPVFDLDDTLYPETDFVWSGFLAAGQWIHNELGHDGFYSEAKSLFESGLRKTVFNVALDNLGLAYDEAFIKTLVQVYRMHKPNITLFPDAFRALERYRPLEPGLITDGTVATQSHKIEALGIVHFFKSLIITDSLGHGFRKPHERPYLETMHRLQASAKDCVYIADNSAKDFVTAKKLGWLTILVERNEGLYAGQKTIPESHRADIIIQDLDELHNHI